MPKTRRTGIWDQAISNVAAHSPLLGYGFTGNLEVEESALQHGHAHNGYIQLFTELGAVGLVIFGIHSLAVITQTTATAIARRTVTDAFFLSYLFYFFLINIPASQILQTDSLLWVLFLIASLRPNLPLDTFRGDVP